MVHADFHKAAKILTELYQYFMAHPDTFLFFVEKESLYDSPERCICDFLAGMTIVMPSISMKSLSPLPGKLYDCKSSQKREYQAIQGSRSGSSFSAQEEGFSQFQYLLQEAPSIGSSPSLLPDSLHRQPDLSSRTGGAYYPKGIPIYPEEDLPRLLSESHARQIVFSYSDVSHEEVMEKPPGPFQRRGFCAPWS
jgi:hypothetical protein